MKLSKSSGSTLRVVIRLRSKAADATGMAKETILEGLDALEAALEDK